MYVALRKESVDRNPCVARAYNAVAVSLSARRAWIEIIAKTQKVTGRSVALRKESVDRNRRNKTLQPPMTGRSPQGERG